jgi:hypothetical protein
MKLKDWLKKDPSLGERLKVIGSLCNTLGESHRRGVVHGGLAPSSISVVNEGSVRLDPVAAGSRTPYAAPELTHGGSPTTKSDIYSAAAVIYEILAGKPPFDSDPPRPLQEARPDLSQDLTDAVSACMEQDPEWRPADLAYLVTVVQQLQKDSPAPSRSQPPRSAAPRESGAAPTFLTPAPGKRQDDRSAFTRALPLVLVVVAIAGTGAAWLWYNVLQPAKPAPAAARPMARASQPPSAAQPEPASASAPPAMAGDPLALPSPARGAATPAPAPTARPSEAPAAQPTPPGAAPSGRPSPPPAREAPATPPPSTLAAPVPETGPDAARPAPPPEPEPSAAASEDSSSPAEAGPAQIRAVAPFKLRAGSLQVLDVHGAGLRADQRVKVVSLRKRSLAEGFGVTRYQLRSPSLLLVFVQVDAAVPPGKYALSLVDPLGAESNPFTIEIVK